MRALTDQEKRTIRIGGLILVCYLSVFYGTKTLRGLEHRRAEHQKLVLQAQQLKREIARYEKDSSSVRQLRAVLHVDPMRLSRNTVVAEVSAAIQQVAAASGVQLGPVRESAARAAAKELTSMQLEGSGAAPAVTALLHHVETLGYPLLIDSVQLNLEPAKPGAVKFNLTIVILDVERWGATEGGNV